MGDQLRRTRRNLIQDEQLAQRMNTESTGKQIELNIDSIPVPITGYIDLQYGDIIRDIKTTMRLPSSVSDAHARQVSVYAKATDSNHAMLDYVVASAKKQEVVSMPVLNIDDHIKVVEDIALAIMNLLSISNLQRLGTTFVFTPPSILPMFIVDFIPLIFLC